MFLRGFWLIICLCTTAVAVERPHIALVLSGGGARGFAHIGVLKMLDDAHIPVDCVVGTSMGALVGGSYALGMSGKELESVVQKTRWRNLLNDKPPRNMLDYRQKMDDRLNFVDFELGLADDGSLKLPRAAIGTHKVDLMIRSMAGNANLPFDQLPLPFRAVATDLESGDMVVLSRGDLAEAMRASMAVPGLFEPVERDARVLVDGGLARNLPVDVARGVCGDVVIAVDVSSPLLSRREVRNALAISDQTLRVMVQRNVDDQLMTLGSHDVLIRPELGNMSPTNFDEVDAAIAAGEKAATAAMSSLSAYRANDADWKTYLEHRDRNKLPPPIIKAIEVEPTRFVNPALLTEATHAEIGKPLDIEGLTHALDKAYASGDYSRIDYRLYPSQEGNDQILKLLPEEKEWGPGYLNFGLGLKTNFSDTSQFSLLAQYRRTWINDDGADWKTRLWVGDKRGVESIFSQPLRVDDHLFVAGGASLLSTPEAVWQGDNHVSDYQLEHRLLELDLGSNWNELGEARLGVFKGKVHYQQITGTSDVVDGTNDDVGLKAVVAYDQLDSARFPREGDSVKLSFVHDFGQWGSSNSWKLVRIETDSARSYGGWVLRGVTEITETGDAPLYDWPSYGGLFRLSGYGEGQLRADRAVFGRVQISRDFAHLSPLLGESAFWGASLEMARLWNVISEVPSARNYGSAALFVGGDTRFGPAYFGVGQGDNGHAQLYLSINGGF